MKQETSKTKYCDRCRWLNDRGSRCTLESFTSQYNSWCEAYKESDTPKKWTSSDVSRPIADVFNMTYLLREY